LDCKAVGTELPAVLEEKYRKVQIKGAIWIFYQRTLPFFHCSLSLFVDCIYTFHSIITLHWRVQSLSVHKDVQSILLWPIPLGYGLEESISFERGFTTKREDWEPEKSTYGLSQSMGHMRYVL
jgi:hypothetical protein